MNKIYRLVWNKSLNLWTVVSENARGVKKKRNVTTNTADTTKKTFTAEDDKRYLPIPTLLAITLSSIFFTEGAFAATNTGGGAVTNSNGSSMAISPTASQCGTGGEARVNGNGGVAVGCGNNISGTDTSFQQALNNRRGTGSNNYPTGAASIAGASTAVGKNNTITGVGGATVVGNSNISDGGNFHNVAFGQGNRTGGVGYNTALGIGNEISSGNSNIAIGVNNRAAGNTAIAMGRLSWADADYSIAQGTTATVAQGATSGIALGNSATTNGVRGVAIGSATRTDGQYDPATAANADGTDAVAIGTGAKGTGNQTTAVGRQAKATGNNSSAYGNEANANGGSAVAVGDQSQAQGDNDIAIGRNAATASGGSNNIAMGNGVTTGATGQNVAMGSGSTTANAASSTGGAVAIGRDQKAIGDGAVALGDPNNANGNGTVALGRNNTAAGDTAGNTAANGAVAIGNENQAIGQGAVALGNASKASAAGAVALGDTANAQASNGVALGSNAVATNANDVALGSGSQTTTATGTGYRTGTAAPASVVSVGSAGNERRIQNLSDGSADTDAVNVRQLKSVQDGVDQLGESTASGLGGGSTYDPTTGTVSNPTYNINGKETNNVGDALTALDKGWTLQSNGANGGAVKAGDTVDIGTADGEENLQVAKEGNNIKYSLNRDLKVDSVTAGDTVINNDGMTIANGPSVTKSGIDVAGNKISNVAAGTEGTDAVNKDQLDTAAAASKTEVEAGKNMTVESKTGDDGQTIYTVATADDVEFNTVKVGDVNIDGTTGKISGVAAGDVNPDSKDAINGSQLAKNAQSVSDALGGGSTVNPDGTVSAPNYTVNGNNVSNVGDAITALDKGWTLQSNGANGGAVKAGDTVDIGTADGEENLQVAKEGNNIKYSLNRDLKVDSVTAGDTVINNDGMTITNGPSVTKSGIDVAGNKISNVAAGTEGTDAVNKDQLDTVAAASKTEVEAGKNMTVESKTGDDGQTIYTVATADDVEFNTVKVGDVNIDGATGKISGVTDGTIAAGSTEAVNGGQLHGVADSVKNSIGGETVLNPDGSVTTSNVGNTGKNNIHDAIDSVRGAAVAAKTTVTQGDNMLVTESKNADGSTNYEVATARDVNFDSVKVGEVNIDGATGKISGVAAGDVNPDSKDAINGSQLAKNAQSVSDALGGGSTVNPDGTVSAPNYTVNGNNVSNVGDAITALDKGWTLQSNGANGGAVKAGDTVDIGTADGEENLQVAKEGNNIKYSLNRDLKVDSVTAGDTVINNDGMTIANGPSVTKSGIDAGGKKLTNVAAGSVSADSTDAINGSQLHAQGEGVKNIIGGNTVYDPNTGRYTNPNIGGTGKDNINDAIGAVGDAAKAAKTTVTEGNNMLVTESKNADGSTNYEVATAKDVKFDSVTATDDEGNETVLTAKGTQVKDGEGNAAEYGAKGITLKDQDGNGTVVNTGGLGFVDAMGNNIGPSITAGGINAGNTVIGGVAAGRVAADSQDAINGSQLNAQGEGVKNIIGGNTVYDPNTGRYTNPDIGGTGKDNINDAIGAVGDAATKAKSTVSEGKNIVVKESKNADGSTDYEVSTSPDLEVDSVTAGGTKVDKDGLHIDGGPSVTKDGIDAGNKKVTGVADGEVAAGSKDAINGGQLKGVSDSVAGAIGGNTTVNPDGTINTSNIGDTGHDNINDAIKSVKQDAQAAKSSVSNKDGNISVKENKNADGSTDYEVGLAKDVTMDSMTAKDVNANQVNVTGDKGTTTITGGGISITGPKGEQGPSMSTDGIHAGGKKVTGVADGAIASGSKDAVNGGQLHQSYQDVGKALGGGAGYDPEKGWTPPSYEVGGGKQDNVGDALNALNNADHNLGDRITNLGEQMQQAFYDTNQRIDDVKKMANAGVAAAMALETAPYISGKYTYAVGAAYHGGENAVGVTLRKTADNGRWSVTTGVAAASQGDPSFRVGLSGVFD